MIEFEPCEDRVLVKKLDLSNKTESGLYVPGTRESPVSTGKVVSVGPGRILQDGTLITRNLNPGDKVMYHSDVALDIEIGFNRFQILEGFDVLGVIKNE